MQTREYLSQLRNIDNRIKDLLKEAERWRDIAISTGTHDFTKPKVQTSPSVDKIGDVVSKLVDYQNECIRLADEKTEIKHTIIEQIKSIKGEAGELYYNLLYGFYIDKKDFNMLAVENGYSYRQIVRSYNKALAEFEKTYGTLYLDLEIGEKLSQMS